jgi:N,N-dimethylformamidase
VSERAPTMKVLGYCDRPSAAAGESIDFHVSCADPGGYDADLVRLRHGDLAVDGPGMKLDPIPGSSIEGHQAGSLEETPGGSFALLPEHGWLGGEEWTLRIRACPWSQTPDRETILHLADAAGNGVALVVEGRRFRAEALGEKRSTVLASEVQVQERCWYELTLRAGSGELTLEIAPVGAPAASRLRFRDPRSSETLSAPLESPLAVGPARLFLAAAPAERDAPFARDHFNGKLEGPRFGAGEELTVDLAAELGQADQHARCTASGPDGEIVGALHNLPMRAVTGSEWTSTEVDYRHAPDQYAAIHFHVDDLADASWPVSLTLDVPADLPSGIYAARLRTADSVDHVPFVVRPPADGEKSPIAFLVPTASYLAYANDKFGPDMMIIQLVAGRVPAMQPESTYLHEHRELGSSLYDTHPDGSGVCFSSWRRPLLNVRPGYSFAGPRIWQFNADLHLVDWLEEKDFDWDAITDHDLHAAGIDLLRGYKTLVLGSHPEYWSGAMLDALETYLDEGGKLMYLGGNGLYWVTGFDPTGSGAVEVRRFGGTEAWTSEPGQVRLQFDGEPGGLWRHRGRAPQRTTGIGFVAQGLDASGFYRRLEPEVRGEADGWVFEGVEAEAFGDFGLAGGGAAGLEIDAVNQALGTPPQTEILASSEGHTEVMLECRDNIGMTMPNMGGEQDPAVRSDLVLFDLEGGGSVFSVGSISWCGSLSHDDYDNPVSRVTENVLRRFSA